jgi:hypothetical protein
MEKKFRGFAPPLAAGHLSRAGTSLCAVKTARTRPLSSHSQATPTGFNGCGGSIKQIFITNAADFGIFRFFFSQKNWPTLIFGIQ